MEYLNHGNWRIAKEIPGEVQIFKSILVSILMDEFFTIPTEKTKVCLEAG